MKHFITSWLCVLALLVAPVYAQQLNQGAGTLSASSSATDNCATANSCVVLALGPNDSSASITLNGTFVGTESFEASASGGARWSAISCPTWAQGASVSSATATGAWTCDVAGKTHLRVRQSAYTSGGPTVSLASGPALASIAAVQVPQALGTTASPTFSVVTATGGVAAVAGGHPILYADTGIPLLGTAGTNTTGIANQLWYTQIFIPHNFTVTNASVLCGGTCTTDKIAIGLWSTAGVLLGSTAATVAAGTVLSGANTWQTLALTSTLALAGPAHYIIGVVTSGTTAGDIQTAPLLGGVCAVSSAQGTLGSFTPVTTTTTNVCPFAFVN